MIAQTSFKTLILSLALLKKEMIERGRMQAMYANLLWHSERELEQAVCKCGQKYRRFPSLEQIEQECQPTEPTTEHEPQCYYAGRKWKDGEPGCICKIKGMGADE